MANKNVFSDYTYRFLARFIIETVTPLAIGSGEKDIITDALVATDVNGLPYIPGTAIAGVVRSMLIQEGVDPETFFGFQKKKDGNGSKIIFTEAQLLTSKAKVIDGLNPSEIKKDPLLIAYAELPIRQHVRICENGVTSKTGKFDEQVVYAGTRFCFELEMVAKDEDTTNFEKAIEQVKKRTFRIGSGTRCGFGEIKVIDLQTKVLNLSKKEQLKQYLDKSSALDSDFWEKEYHTPTVNLNAIGWTEYTLNIQPEDFFLFGSGFGDDDSDMTPVKARKVDWKSGIGVLKDKLVLIPATSVKGALAHRVAFHWNRLHGYCVGNPNAKVGNESPVIQALFGYEDQPQKKQERGNLIFSDVIAEERCEDKVLNHVKIDRFTGGALEGALFSEKVFFGKGQHFTLTILAKSDVLKKDPCFKDSLEAALDDICHGRLPLGGGVNRGNGVFTGSLTINEK